MPNIRAQIKRRFSRHEKNENFDEHSDADEDTASYVQKQIDEAEKNNYDSGKPGSLLNRLISHGNKKTEEQMMRDSAAAANAGTDASGAASGTKA